MDILSKLPERLGELMFEKNVTPKDLAPHIGVNRCTVNRYLRGTRLPNFCVFVKILDFFPCSADFILGLVDHTPPNTTFYPTPKFSERFRELMSEYKTSQYALHKKTKFSYDNFNKWLKGDTHPFVDNLIKLANAFDCSVDYLLGRVK
ncbi:MAG: transcriptional regulator [Clostridia bacterium]|nr:transcriptional regulator [Clostridia bacterium]